LYDQIKSLPSVERGPFGKQINELKQAIEQAIAVRLEELEKVDLKSIDVTAPMDMNSPKPELLLSEQGTIHPLSAEIERISEIFNRMGFVTEESREIDDQFHMFESLNFPKGHPARDDYDTFMTEETDSNGDRLIAPAHTSTMQNRVLMKYRDNLEKGEAIAAIVPDRVFRNEDLDARHEHTFYQVEGVYVSRRVNVGNLIATLQEFLQEYYGKKLDVRVNPFYFPFTEPSFEFALSCPFCEGKNPDCKVCSGEGWIELLGCGMIHPNVLRAAQIDPNEYTGFAFGCGIDRLVMMKYGIEDVRHFESGKLDFLEQF
jgi:phenylalanine--tRNA ligase, alpha subunit